MNQPSGQDSKEGEVIRLAKAGELLLAFNMYRQIHHVGLKEARDAVEKLADLPRTTKPIIPSVGLSPETQRRLEILFQVAGRAEATRMVVEECGNSLPFLEKLDAVGLERYRFAALKLSGGDLSELRRAVELAKVDWRDLLVAAGFANDTRAHERWMPSMRRSESR